MRAMILPAVLAGEPMPVSKERGSGVTAGSINGDGVFVMQAGRGGDGPGRNGRRPPHAAPSRARTPIAYVFQDAHLFPWFSVEENIALPLSA